MFSLIVKIFGRDQIEPPSQMGSFGPLKSDRIKS